MWMLFQGKKSLQTPLHFQGKSQTETEDRARVRPNTASKTCCTARHSSRKPEAAKWTRSFTLFLTLILTFHSSFFASILFFFFFFLIFSFLFSSSQQVREHYLRDDIYCGAPICKVCDSSNARLSPSASTILIVDTNVVLNQVIVNFQIFVRLLIFSYYLILFCLELFDCRLICLRTQQLMMLSCYRSCWKRLRTRTCRCTIELEFSAAIPWEGFLCLLMNTTSMLLYFIM